MSISAAYVIDPTTGFYYQYTPVDNGDGTWSDVFTRVAAPDTPSQTASFLRPAVQFAAKVLMKIGVYDAGSPLDAVDVRNVTEAYDAVYQMLLDEGLVTWAATDDIPVRFSLSLIDLVAGQVKPYYAIPQNAIEMLPLFDQPAVKTIRRQLASPYISDVTTAEYF